MARRRSSSRSTRPAFATRSPAWRGSRAPAGRRAGLCRASRRCAERRGRRAPLLPRVQGDARPHGRRTAHRAPRRGSPEPCAPAAHPGAVPLLRPGQGMARGTRSLPGRSRSIAASRGGRQLHRDLLRPLFFGTLNRAPAERTRGAAGFGAIPFLNGGLFEPHPARARISGATSPTRSGATPSTGCSSGSTSSSTEQGGGGIAPDMLGRVFEGVMAPDVRRAPRARTTRRPRWSARCSTRRSSRSRPAASGATRARPSAGCATAIPPSCPCLTELSAARPGGRLGRLSPGRARSARLTRGAGRPAHAVRSSPHPPAQPVRGGPERRGRAARPSSASGSPSSQTTERIGRSGSSRLPNLDCLIRQGDSLFEPVGGSPAADGRPGPRRRRRGPPAAACHGHGAGEAGARARAPAGGMPGGGGIASRG